MTHPGNNITVDARPAKAEFNYFVGPQQKLAVLRPVTFPAINKAACELKFKASGTVAASVDA